VAAELGWDGPSECALDFGCGVGRLIRALSGRFNECIGVDISERMLEHARRLNADRPSCRFLVNRRSDLRPFADDTFDLVLFFVVLQHVSSPEAALRYVTEFVRVTRPGGLVAFQLPSPLGARSRLQLRRRAYGVLRVLGLRPDYLQRLGLNPMRMIGVPEHEVRRVVEASGGVVARADTDALAPGIPGFRYFVLVPASGDAHDGS